MLNYNYIEIFRENILKWSYSNYRDFLWRYRDNPYDILISEFMLQRTKAEQVNKVYGNFLKSYPSVQLLSAARINDVERILKPLGLFWRSKHFIEAAKYIEYKFGGSIPINRKEILMIPGVGDYIAGMVLMTAFNISDWAVDSNIARIFNRFFGLGFNGEIRRKKEIIDMARNYFNNDNPRKSAYAILDFAALICKDKNPDCKNCPVNSNCLINTHQCCNY